MTRICLVRHGETDWNVERRIQGQTDSRLNARGRAQAQAMGRLLQDCAWDAIISSDLMRARETAAIISNSKAGRVELREDLRERRYGVFQGLTYPDAARRYPLMYERFHQRDPNENFNGGESLAEFCQRVTTALSAIAAKHDGKTVLLIAHGGVLDIAYRMVTAMPLGAPRDFTISNAGASWIVHEASGWRMISWNQTADDSVDELPG